MVVPLIYLSETTGIPALIDSESLLASYYYTEMYVFVSFTLSVGKQDIR